MEWINFRHLYSFWKVSHAQSFTKASKEMLVAQSAVSNQVSQLEEYLGEKVFIRSTRKLDLTDAGRQLLRYADIIFENSKEINGFLKDKELPGSSKRLLVGVVGGATRNFVYRSIQAFMQEHSKTSVHVVTGSFSELSTKLKRFELDLIITLELPMKKDLDEFTHQRIGQSSLVLAGPKKLINSLNSNKRTKSVEIYKFSHAYETELVENVVRPLINVESNLKLTTDDIPLLRFFANSNNGLVLIPKIGILEDIQSGRMAFIDLKIAEEINIYGVSNKKGVHQKSVNDFIQGAQRLNHDHF